MIIHAKVALLSMLATFSWNGIFRIHQYSSFYFTSTAIILFVATHGVLLIWSYKFLIQHMWRAYLFGAFLWIGANIVWHAPPLYLSTGLYICLLSTFHLGEYLATALFNPTTITIDSFLLNHSVEFNLALAVSWLEHGILVFICPGMKSCAWITTVGFLLTFTGDFVRKLAMYTAGKSFNHIVQYQKEESHGLVTSGVYGLVRHPSYTGWFIWSISTQILLCNPVCCVAYAIASWKFFSERIFYEESTLLNFFGQDYVNYQKKVPSGIPFVSGFILQYRS
ncbi:uncharacterized protein LOC143470402 [Clavelina lepadiformis]|uniref:Protein-S-isoprenylcysteine O-methyltransferase n=1 Tax=Clavelina lepadiformis TaxID=159417 RepID=A0ABP0FG54_CLALP